MKRRYIFTKDADISPMGYGQQASADKKKHFKKGDVVWGEVYKNSVLMTEPPTQGYALHVPIDGKDVSEGWDVPLPPMGNGEVSPVIPYPIVTIKNAAIVLGIGVVVYGLLKITKIIK
jgi:hypothetical protein